MQVALFSAIPLYLATLSSSLRLIFFSIYISLLLFMGGLFGAVASYPITGNIIIPGGSIAYAGLFMATMMLVLLENRIGVVRQLIRLVITVDVFKLLFFAALSLAVGSGADVNSLAVSSGIFSTSIKVVIVGGLLIIGEMLFLLFIFEKVKKHMASPLPLAVIFSLCFCGVLLTDGVLFSLIMDMFEPNLAGKVLAGVQVKGILALSFLPSMFLFMVLFRERIRYFAEAPLVLVDILRADEEELRQEIKRQQLSLERRDRLFLQMAESIDDVFFILDEKLTITYWNKSSEVLGYGAEQVVGQPFADIFPYKRSSKELGMYKAALRDQHSQIFETRYFVNGKWLTYEVSATPRNQGVSVIGRDITQRLLLENGLREAQKMEALGTLAGGIAHDLNNILNIINGYTELSLLKTPADSDVSGYLQNISKVKDRAAALVRQILSFSRMDNARFELLDPAAAANETVEMLRAMLPAQVEFSVVVPDDCGWIRADKTQLNQVLMNLVTNGYHAMEGVGGVLRLEIEQVAVSDSPLAGVARLPDQLPDRCLKISVSDTGRGISPELLPRIFDPFFTTKGVGQGTGLGLAVVQGIVKRHLGEIRVNSSQGVGSEFTLYLPLVEPGVELEGEVEASDLNYQTSNAHLLVVEDEPGIRELYATFLESLGYTLSLCADGREALDAFQKNPDGFQLVFTDLDMPNMNGEQLIQELRRMRPELPIVLATGMAAMLSPEEAADLGVRHYLIKPVKLNDILAAIESALGKSDTGREVAGAS